AHEAGVRQHRAVGPRWLSGEHIKADCGEPTAIQRFEQHLVIGDETTSRRVDEDRPGLAGFQELPIDHAPRPFVQWAVQRDDVGLAHELAETDSPYSVPRSV